MCHSVTFHVCPRSGSPTMLDYDPGTKNQPAPHGSLGGTGKRNTPDSRAPTFRILAPDVVGVCLREKGPIFYDPLPNDS